MLTINDAWLKLTGGASPIAHELRLACADRWIRFHSLPDSKRYAECEAEYTELLSRHNAIICSFATQGDVLHLITANFSDTAEAKRCYEELESLDPIAKHWRSIEIESDWYYHVFHSSMTWLPGCVDDLLLLVADDQIREVAIIAGNGDWAYHPYDGGGDLICPDEELRDKMASRFHAWRSRRQDGM